ncbi:peptidylprolyl isomerase [Tessaracoccus caeni]|uniref:peptidylprolyl isomerase n=1 Tax=Tessaracoccus caeni TaxID=3031239 RepID=UPI0023DA49DC|nr:peptidylprolyl isomerase [Tessaracoccus caeni]MDF1490111.1 peptidylprolyl isomerase [Tessaracoccus caeni]
MRVKKTVVVTSVLALALVGCADANQSARPYGDQPVGTQAAREQSVVTAGECAYPAESEPARPVDPPSTTNVANKGEVTATLHMTAGDVTLTLDRAQAPCTVNSFVSLIEQGFYDDTVCHRLVDTRIFILQCGDPTATGTGGPGYTIPDEVTPELTYPRGTLAMAKRQQPNTGGSQFFLVWDDTDLPPEYTVFGAIDDAGLDVIGGIAAQGVDAADGMSPIAEAKITSVSLG